MIENPEILAIKSDKQELAKVEEFLLEVFERQNLPKKCFNKVFLCVSEAVLNSIEHGNKNNKKKEVAIQVNCRKGNICIEINDEGEGFDYTVVDDPTSEVNIKKETGRGIFIMKTLCNKVEFRDRGKSVAFKIDLK